MTYSDPTIKRTICKTCGTVLLPGTTATIRTQCTHSIPNSFLFRQVKTLTESFYPLASRCRGGHVVSYKCNTCQTVRKIPAPPLLDREAQPEHDSNPSQDIAPQSEAMSEDSQPSAGPSHRPADEDSSAVAQSEPHTQSQTPVQKRIRRTKIQPRLPPLFERNAGHVVFRGAEMIPDEEQMGPLFASNIGFNST